MHKIGVDEGPRGSSYRLWDLRRGKAGLERCRVAEELVRNHRSLSGIHEIYMYFSVRVLRRRKVRVFIAEARRRVFAILSKLPAICSCCIWRIQVATAMVESAAESEYGSPVAQPIDTLADLAGQKLLKSPVREFLEGSVPLPLNIEAKRPQLLVCHDYKGGYQEDKWVQGRKGMEGYVLWHWHLVDVFVYFSHSLVTIPPPGWINAGHKHGVPVLGTFITEWARGASVCRELLASAETCCMYASQLADLAYGLGFDGWLVNIENKVDTKDLPRLHLFLQHLRQCMHTLKPNSDVIWYDAVTDEGDLDWQNCLNEKNRSFFAVSDGLFTNYTWSEGMAKLSANAAGERNFEVYMGVDVFGRNTFGGGGFDCDKALKVAREGEVSAALFAPAWVYETNQPPSFEIAQSRWWSRIEDCWPIARCSPIALPFFTDFNRGCGTRVAVEGKEVSTQPWFNLSCQNLQPILKVIALSESPLEVSMSHEAAYSGGSCIKLTGSDDSQGLVLLYECNVPVKTREIHTSYCVHVDDQLHICIALIIHRESSRIVVLLVEEGSQVQVPSTLKNCVVQQATRKADLETLNSESNKWIVRKHVLELGICALSQIYAVTYSHELDVKKLISLVEDNTLTTRTLITDSVAGSKDPEILHGMLGHLRISTEREHDRELPNIVFEGCEPQWTQKSEAWKSVSLTLRWGLVQMHSSPGNCQWVQYHVYISKDGESRGCSVSRGDPEFLGVSVVKAFSVQDLLISSSCTMLNFHVQAHCACGLPGALTAPCIVSNSNSNPSSHLDSDISGPVLKKHAV